MKTFLLLALVAGIYFLASKDAPATTAPALTRGALMAKETAEFLNMVREFDFACHGSDWPTGYQRVANRLDVALIWGDPTNFRWRDDRLACTTGDTIWMLIPPCNPLAKEVFFHEVGHVLMGHTTQEISRLLSDDKVEGEAYYFSAEVMNSLGEFVLHSEHQAALR